MRGLFLQLVGPLYYYNNIFKYRYLEQEHPVRLPFGQITFAASSSRQVGQHPW